MAEHPTYNEDASSQKLIMESLTGKVRVKEEEE